MTDLPAARRRSAGRWPAGPPPALPQLLDEGDAVIFPHPTLLYMENPQGRIPVQNDSIALVQQSRGPPRALSLLLAQVGLGQGVRGGGTRRGAAAADDVAEERP